METISISDVGIQTLSAVKSLGVTLDRKLTACLRTCAKHATFTGESCVMCDRLFLTTSLKLWLVALSVCGSTTATRYVGMSASNFDKLQRVQNTLARVVLLRGQYDHISSALAELHWLPTKQRVIFKVATLASNVKRENQPSYLRDLLCDCAPSRCLRSSTQDLPRVKRSKTVISARMFRHVTADSWNSLPIPIRNCNCLCSFKSKLKTHLFKPAFTDCTH